ncbi:MAG: hypothetical protein CUN49_08740 [Candidatus Thermofonsia Clade 1 bacterium]|uniref:MPN domain-containing protein n=1 Tax=Candidatus Thermofonsia Clade 1 bacterium TaxID=2364210 RepID=A0A2M8PE36_9CHLR|nr:MAG: hypothetical protein CUN49_08740 [Candidatus Thermofonsia Clade 1 bacterium]
MPLALSLPSTLRRALQAEAQRGAPNEVCGLLGGVQRGPLFQAACYMPVPNCAATPQMRFAMQPEAMVAAILALQRAGYAPIGVYHSHPHSAPVPSAVDIAEGAWQATPYLIIGYAATQPSLAAWLIEGRSFTHLALI